MHDSGTKLAWAGRCLLELKEVLHPQGPLDFKSSRSQHANRMDYVEVTSRSAYSSILEQQIQ